MSDPFGFAAVSARACTAIGCQCGCHSVSAPPAAEPQRMELMEDDDPDTPAPASGGEAQGNQCEGECGIPENHLGETVRDRSGDHRAGRQPVGVNPGGEADGAICPNHQAAPPCAGCYERGFNEGQRRERADWRQKSVMVASWSVAELEADNAALRERARQLEEWIRELEAK